MDLIGCENDRDDVTSNDLDSQPPPHSLNRMNGVCDGLIGGVGDGDHENRVHAFANAIYAECERVIGMTPPPHGNAFVAALMPNIIGILEALETQDAAARQLDLTLRVTEADRASLLVQYEREKSERKVAERRLIETEHAHDEQRAELEEQLDTLRSLVKMLELKNNSLSEQTSRLEERETEFKKDFSNLHQRHADLLKNSQLHHHQHHHQQHQSQSHFLHIKSRNNSRNSTKRSPRLPSQSPPPPAILHSKRENKNTFNGELEMEMENGDFELKLDCDAASHHGNLTMIHDTNKIDDNNEQESQSHYSNKDLNCSPKSAAFTPNNDHDNAIAKNDSHYLKELKAADKQRDGEATDEEEELQQEFGDEEDEEEEEDEFTRQANVEIEALMNENYELLETKNALNIVKNDLIFKVDELTGENQLLHEEKNALLLLKKSYRERLHHLEVELRAAHAELECVRPAASSHEDEEEAHSACSLDKDELNSLELDRIVLELEQLEQLEKEGLRDCAMQENQHALMEHLWGGKQVEQEEEEEEKEKEQNEEKRKKREKPTGLTRIQVARLIRERNAFKTQRTNKNSAHTFAPLHRHNHYRHHHHYFDTILT